jgi:hypothetical protein
MPLPPPKIKRGNMQFYAVLGAKTADFCLFSHGYLRGAPATTGATKQSVSIDIFHHTN